MQKTTGQIFKEGVRDGVPIGLGYFAVSFALGIMAKQAGLNPLMGGIASLLNNASAGEYAGFAVIMAGGTYLEIMIITLIANARYLLMSCAMSQRFKPGEKLIHRIFVGYGITDELFGIAIAREGYINPFYSYGAFCMAMPGWAIGTALGIVAGELLPANVVSALGVALFGMFIAIIIPPAKKEKLIGVIIAVCFAASFAASRLPYVRELSEGTRTIILTVLIAGAAAILFPRKEESDES